MRVEFDPSSSLVLQQALTGTSVFDGTDVGRASLTLGAGDAAVTVKAKHLGTHYNGTTVRLIGTGSEAPTETVFYDQVDNRIDVFLRKSGGSVISTPLTVAAAIQARGIPFTASAGGAGTGTVVAATGVLAGAINPSLVRGVQFKFAPASPANGGRFSFDQASNIVVRQFEATLSGSVAWTLDLIGLDEGLVEIAGETVRYASGTGTTVLLVDRYLVLSPFRALKFTANAQGVARMVAHKEPGYQRA